MSPTFCLLLDEAFRAHPRLACSVSAESRRRSAPYTPLTVSISHRRPEAGITVGFELDSRSIPYPKSHSFQSSRLRPQESRRDSYPGEIPRRISRIRSERPRRRPGGCRTIGSFIHPDTQPHHQLSLQRPSIHRPTPRLVRRPYRDARARPRTRT